MEPSDGLEAAGVTTITITGAGIEAANCKGGRSGWGKETRRAEGRGGDGRG